MNKQTVLPQGFRSLCTDADIRWHDARRESGHSNFQFVDDHYESEPTIRRIFSLARQLGFRSFCLESVSCFSADIVPLFLRLPGFIYFEGDEQVTRCDDDIHISLLKNFG